MDETSKKLKRMTTWTIVVFVVIFAIVMTVLWLPLYNAGASPLGAVGQALAAGWLMFVLVAVLCIAAYYGYKFYLNRKK